MEDLPQNELHADLDLLTVIHYDSSGIPWDMNEFGRKVTNLDELIELVHELHHKHYIDEYDRECLIFQIEEKYPWWPDPSAPEISIAQVDQPSDKNRERYV